MNATLVKNRLMVAGNLLSRLAVSPEEYHFRAVPGQSKLMQWHGLFANEKSHSVNGFVLPTATRQAIGVGLVEAVEGALKVYIDYGNPETGKAYAAYADEKYHPIREGYIGGHRKLSTDAYVPCMLGQLRSKDGERIPTENIVLLVQPSGKVLYKHPSYESAFDWAKGTVLPSTENGVFTVCAPPNANGKEHPECVVAATLAGEDQAHRWLNRRKALEAGLN